MILFHHIAGAQLLAAPVHSAAASHRVASRRNAPQRSATQHHALHRTTSRRFATQHRATQRNFKRNPAHHPTLFKFPWRDQTQPWVTVPSLRGSWLCTATLRFAPQGFAPQHNAISKGTLPAPTYPIQIPMARSDAALGHSVFAPPHNAAHRGAVHRTATQRNE